MQEPSSFQLVAGHVALDFANTLDNRDDPERVVDLIGTYPEFLRFSREVGVITSEQENSLAQYGNERESALSKADELREALQRIFESAIEGSPVSAADLVVLNDAIKEAMQHRGLLHGGTGFGWTWIGMEENADGPLWPIAQAAADLLVSGDLQRVRQCGSETCGWLFLDTSKNHSRRWCDMKLCGNRIKARNYYRRGRKEHASGQS